MAEEPEPGILDKLLRFPSPDGQMSQPKSSDLASRMYQRGPSITMKSRTDNEQIGWIFLAMQMGSLYDDKSLTEAARLLLELLISTGGLGRQEAVELARAIYITSIGASPPSKDAALE